MSAAMLTVEQVRAQVERIRAIAAVDAAAHIKEDELYIHVLRAVAGGHPGGAALAEAALLTAKIKFARRCV